MLVYALTFYFIGTQYIAWTNPSVFFSLTECRAAGDQFMSTYNKTHWNDMIYWQCEPKRVRFKQTP